ncbi:hypothetical protein COCON_G00203030 [Conger conger]|uniref:Phospholipase A2 n=1 Tax=Conger conger TaxID=82655 RepID=A0A9Q1CZ24_CONCO|nr:hypothetical protein COCON_G00203030 [Conger conger]
MSSLYLTLLLFSVRVVSLTPEKSQRSKRGLLELAGAIKCSTGRSALSYMMYGCYCGLGGRGWPRDRADWCCHRHDCCYGTAEFAGCRTMTDRYDWTCEDRVPDCDSLKDSQRSGYQPHIHTIEYLYSRGSRPSTLTDTRPGRAK